MPSPIGHTLAGVAAAWSADLVPGNPSWRGGADRSWFERAGGWLTVICGMLAAAPDLDLLVHSHRTVTHSVGAVILVTIIAAVMTGWVTERPVIRTALTCGAAYATHLLLDWLEVDPMAPFGIQALWPFTSGWYLSGWDLFPAVHREHFWSRAIIALNAHAVLAECVRLLPVLAGLWLVRVKAFARLPTQVTRRDHAPQ
jgi:inner membrane protein